MAWRDCARDWVEIRKGLSYSESLGMYFHKGSHYSKASAEHRGLIGPGYELRNLIAKHNAANEEGR